MAEQHKENLIDVSKLLCESYPKIRKLPSWVQKTVFYVLRQVVLEEHINRFLEKHSHLKNFSFIDCVLEELNIGPVIHQNELIHIPANGRVIIIANHPLGGAEALSFIQLIGNIRQDVKVVANQLLCQIKPITGLLLPIDNMGGNIRKAGIQKIYTCLQNEEAVIIFPAAEVSRGTAKGIRDSHWYQGFLHIAERTQSCILPVRVQARNSALFYFISYINKKLSTLLLPRELIKFRGVLRMRIGEALQIDNLNALNLNKQEKVQLIRKHLYSLGTKGTPILKTTQSIIHPVDRQIIQQSLNKSQVLGHTHDGKKILLFSGHEDSPVINELGRLREISFRAIGAGSGKKKDIDSFDFYYKHLILWDTEALEIVGAYRLGEVWSWHDKPKHTLYSETLFDFTDDMQAIKKAGVELGRSFIQPRYWGLRALDYLWQGLGLYFQANPQVRYFFGAVSIPNHLPKALRDALIYFYKKHYTSQQTLAKPILPYTLLPETEAGLSHQFSGGSLESDRRILKQQFDYLGFKIPVLFKHYTDAFKKSGCTFSDFNIDRDFSLCIDSLIVTDLTMITEKTKKRYLNVADTIQMR
jgi:putative hemolysin